MNIYNVLHIYSRYFIMYLIFTIIFQIWGKELNNYISPNLKQ